MGRQLDGLAYGGRSLASTYAPWTPKPKSIPDPTHCDRCACPVNKAKAKARFHRAVPTSTSTTTGQCACGAWLYYDRKG
jgi:hypothetical protein